MKPQDVIENIGKTVIFRQTNHFSPQKNKFIPARLVDRSLHSPSQVQIEVLVRGEGRLMKKLMTSVKVENVMALTEYMEQRHAG